MPEPTKLESQSLQATAWRYAAGDLPPQEAAAFELRLAEDQPAREALAEAVRLSAAALGQDSPSPDSSFRSLIRDRLRPLHRWTPNWLARRAYRGHPLAWAGIGAGIVAAAAVFAVNLSRPISPQPVLEHPETAAAVHVKSEHPPTTDPGTAHTTASNDDGNVADSTGDVHDDSARKAAEIWAEFSTTDHVEKSHDDEARLHQRFKNLHSGHPNHSASRD